MFEDITEETLDEKEGLSIERIKEVNKIIDKCVIEDMTYGLLLKDRDMWKERALKAESNLMVTDLLFDSMKELNHKLMDDMEGSG